MQRTVAFLQSLACCVTEAEGGSVELLNPFRSQKN